MFGLGFEPSFRYLSTLCTHAGSRGFGVISYIHVYNIKDIFKFSCVPGPVARFVASPTTDLGVKS